MDSILAILITVISGVLVYIIGEIIHEVWLEPLRQYKEIKSEVSYSLTYYANLYSNVIDLADKHKKAIKTYSQASDQLRVLAAKLRGFIETLSWFKPLIPSRETLYSASKELIGLSNSFFCPYHTHEIRSQCLENRDQANEIRKLLSITPID